MGRGMQIAVFVAAVTGSVGGGLAALLASAGPLPPRPTTVAAPTAPPVAAGSALAPVAAAVAPPADPRIALVASMKLVLTRVAGWARDHAGEPCPDLAALGVVAPDPWGHPLELTCSDQPADQIVGAVSAGPDGIAGSDDDIASWALGSEVTALVRGARWKPLAATRTRPGRHRRDVATTSTAPVTRPAEPVRPLPPVTTTIAAPTAAAPAASIARPDPAVGDDIPTRR
jgi:hypothetical protein